MTKSMNQRVLNDSSKLEDSFSSGKKFTCTTTGSECCSTCGLRKQSMRSLFGCSFCMKVFPMKQHLDAHFRREHLCAFCAKKFLSEGALKCHISHHHGFSRNFLIGRIRSNSGKFFIEPKEQLTLFKASEQQSATVKKKSKMGQVKQNLKTQSNMVQVRQVSGPVASRTFKGNVIKNKQSRP